MLPSRYFAVRAGDVTSVTRNKARRIAVNIAKLPMNARQATVGVTLISKRAGNRPHRLLKHCTERACVYSTLSLSPVLQTRARGPGASPVSDRGHTMQLIS
jgi:hypothetical protein